MLPRKVKRRLISDAMCRSEFRNPSINVNNQCIPNKYPILDINIMTSKDFDFYSRDVNEMERWLEAHSGGAGDSGGTGPGAGGDTGGEAGAGLARRDAHGYTLAHWAALGGHVAALQLLLHRGAPLDLSCLGTQGPRPIHWACRKGHTAAVHLLLHAGVSVNAADFKGVTPLMTACMYGRAATAAYLLGMGAATHLTDVNGDAAMHWAAYKAHPDLVRTLIYAGAPAHAPDHFGSTPLHLACISGNVTCVRLLSEQCAGATGAGGTARGLPPSLEARDKNGKTPLQLAQSHRHAEAVALLVRARRRHSRLAALTALLFGGAGNSKGPLLLFVGSVVLWGYPLYLLRCVPLTWHAARLSHYSFIWWNVVMWVSWAVANRRQPGFLARNSDAYRRAIRALPHLDKWRRGGSSGRVLARLCHTCRCVRPLRAKHCRTCGRCVAHFDHHCPFIYNCVGLRNRGWFFLFVVCVAINCSYSIYFACYCVLLEGWGALYVLGLAEAGAFCVLGWALSCTAALHAAMNLTTNEMVNYKRYAYLRDARGKYTNPFSRGLLLNLLEFAVCLPAPDPDPDLDLDLDFDPDFAADVDGDRDRDHDPDPRHDPGLDPGRHV